MNDKMVLEYHDLHISEPSSKYNFISFHIVLKDDELSLCECEKITDEIKHELEHHGFNHILIQVDTVKKLMNQTHCDIS
jgi:Co/Zn/Cd efflux system component